MTSHSTWLPSGAVDAMPCMPYLNQSTHIALREPSTQALKPCLEHLHELSVYPLAGGWHPLPQRQIPAAAGRGLRFHPLHCSYIHLPCLAVLVLLYGIGSLFAESADVAGDFKSGVPEAGARGGHFLVAAAILGALARRSRSSGGSIPVVAPWACRVT